jgi:plastocyanin
MSSRPDLYGEVRFGFRIPIVIVIPIAALLLIAAGAIGFSQVLLAVPSEAAVVIALLMAINVLGACAVIATRRLSGIQLAELVAVVLYPVIIGLAIAQFGLGEEAEGSETSAPATGGTKIAASGVAFTTDEITLPANEEVTLTFDNQDSVAHNFAIYETEQANKEIFVGDQVTADSIDYTFKTPGPGEYFFRCDFHPDQMTGTAIVE